MSEQAVIDNLAFARRRGVLQATVAVADLAGLRESLLSSEGVLHYSLAGNVGAKGEPLLECVIEGGLVLQCQRCLQALQYPLHIVSRLRLVQEGTEFDVLDDEEEGTDSIPVNVAMDVVALIEEEVLLDLPIAPVHPSGACVAGDGTVTPDEEKPSPFGALAALKGKL